MRKEKKVSRVEEEVVCIVEWTGAAAADRRWLFVKRPEKGESGLDRALTSGLLAGLFEPPTTPIPLDSTIDVQVKSSFKTLVNLLDISVSQLSSSITSRHAGQIPHIFSHINMTYHIHHLVLATAELPGMVAGKTAVWLDDEGVQAANVGTGVKKVWAEAFGTWGTFEVGVGASRAAKGSKQVGKKRKVGKEKVDGEGEGEKVKKRIMMPAMPKREI
jgi:A/G-specific adenine glycosylase